MGARRLKIAMLSVHSCPLGRLGEKDTGGMSVYVRELARQLGRRGHLVDVYTRVHDPNDDLVVELGLKARLIHLNAGEERDIDKLALYPHLDEFACNLENIRKRSDIRYDLIHSHYWLSGWVGERVQEWWGIPHITMFHTLGAVKNAVGIGEGEAKLRIETEKDLANKCHRIIAATTKERDDLVHHYGASPDTITVIPCGVNLELFQPVDRTLARQRLNLDGERVVLFVGRIDPLKGIENLLVAVSNLSRTHHLKLIVAGGGDKTQSEVERLKGLSRQLQIDDQVAFLGSMSQEDLPQLYNAADVCVVPSYYESFGLVALESLACGTPVVATRVGGIESLIRQGETGYIVAGNAPETLADTIATLFSSQSNGIRSASYIRGSVAGFNWSNVAAAMLKQYEETLRSMRRPATATTSRTINW
ncbi:glycosyltransferase [Dehalococcoidia bacterium]|nr:glycosyltransferase [Dehalococcoidia bacterium]